MKSTPFPFTAIFTAHQRSLGKVIFIVVCVCRSVCLRGGSHVIISHDASDHPSSRQLSVPVGGGPMLPLPMMKLDLTLQGPAVPK